MAKQKDTEWTITGVYGLRDALIARGESPMTPIKSATTVNVLTFLLVRIHELEAVVADRDEAAKVKAD